MEKQNILYDTDQAESKSRATIIFAEKNGFNDIEEHIIKIQNMILLCLTFYSIHFFTFSFRSIKGKPISTKTSYNLKINIFI